MQDGFLRLDGRWAIVTGGARGIGLATAKRLTGAGAEAWAIHVDVTSPGSITKGLAASLERCPGVDVLVNNAGIPGRSGPISELSDGDSRGGARS